MPIYVEKIKDKNGKMIEKKVDGQKQYFIRTYVTDEFGNTKQITRHNKKWLGRNGYNLAQQEEVRLKNSELIELNKIKHAPMTLKQLKDKYIEFIKPKTDKDTLKSKETKLNHFCEIDTTQQVSTYPNRDISLFDKELYQIWQCEMKNKKYNDFKNYSIRYLNSVHNEICTLLDYAVLEGYCNTNFAKQAGKFGTPKEIKMSKYQKQYQTISYDEYIRLLNVSKQDLKYNIIFDLCFTRGPRPGEIRAFKVKDFNFEKKQLMVNHTLSKSNELKEPKTASSKNTIDLDNELANKINDLIMTYKSKNNFDENWFLFGNANMPISSHALDYNKDKYFKLANINKHLRLHDFRHSCATWLFSIGIPITVISRILRHQDISTTMQTYTHLVQEDYDKSLQKLKEIKSRQDQKQDQNY